MKYWTSTKNEICRTTDNEKPAPDEEMSNWKEVNKEEYNIVASEVWRNTQKKYWEIKQD